MNSKFDYICYGCLKSAKAPVDSFTCVNCGEPLSLRALAGSGEVFRQPLDSLWSYFDLLPVNARSNIVSLHEGGTPLVSAPRLARELGIAELLVKNEAANPTGSFKDRQVSVGVSHAKEIGAGTVAVVSSGNVACAAAAYAARAGIRAVLFMHGHAAPAKVTQAAVYGGKAIRVNSSSARAVFELCLEACRTFGWYHLSTAGMYEPFNVEGAKTIAYEIYQQTEGDMPDWIVAPVGGGGLLGGIWRGLLDLQRVGLVKTLPRLAGVQASGCAPLTQAIQEGTKFLDTLKTPWPNPKTIAGGIADDILFDGHTVLPAIRSTNGVAFDVSDEETLAASAKLAATEGLFCEPTSAVAFAALRRVAELTPEARICCVMTGSGIKDVEAMRRHVPEPASIEPSLAAVEQAAGAKR